MTSIMIILGVISLIALCVGIKVTFWPTDADIEAHLDRWAD